jgi:hypothetical protein
MARTAISVAIGVLFVGAVIWAALSGSSAQCEICVEYKGRSACQTAAAAGQAQAEAQAQSGACAQVAGGVTETLECASITPSVRRCSE